MWRYALLVGAILAFGLVLAQPVPTQCAPGLPCKASSFTATKTTGNALVFKGDSGLLFGDGTYQNTAGGPTDGGTTGTGSNTDVTFWTGTSTLSGDGDLTYTPSTGVLYLDGGIKINGNVSGGLAYVQPAAAFACFDGPGCVNYLNVSADSLFVNGHAALRLQSTSGNVNADPGNGSAFIVGAGFNNFITVKPTISGTDPSIAVSAAQNDAGLNFTTPGNGPLYFDGDPIPAVHRAAYNQQISMEFGADSGTVATPTLMSVTFSTPFSLKPACSCGCEGANTCFINAPGGIVTTVGATFGCASNGGVAKVVEWFCVGPK